MNGMDINAWKEQLLTRLGKYRYVLLVILAGVVLLLLPLAGEKRETQPPAAVQSSVVDSFDTGAMERRLEDALSQVEGAGRVTVVLSVQAGPRQIWARDSRTEERAEERSREESTVVLSRGSGMEETVPVQQISPQFRGALVVCSGGGDPAVRLSLVEAVSALTGLGSDKISICRGK